MKRMLRFSSSLLNVLQGCVSSTIYSQMTYTTLLSIKGYPQRYTRDTKETQSGYFFKFQDNVHITITAR